MSKELPRVFNVPTSFSHPSDWDCLYKLVSKYPLNRQACARSAIIREAVELLSKTQKTQQTINLDDFKDNTLPRLDLDSKAWKELVKSNETQDLRQLQKIMQTKINIVNDEIYRRTV